LSKTYQPYEYIVLRILYYLVSKDRAYADTVGASRYEISKMPGLHTQHQKIVKDALSELKMREWVEETSTPRGARYYKVTEKGKQAYTEWGARFLRFSEEARQRRLTRRG